MTGRGAGNPAQLAANAHKSKILLDRPLDCVGQFRDGVFMDIFSRLIRHRAYNKDGCVDEKAYSTVFHADVKPAERCDSARRVAHCGLFV
jgi:hypothetical protein